jgi:hypothetical protein
MAAEEPHQQLDLLGERTSTLKGLSDRPFEEDTSTANGASIAMLAEFEIRSVLLTGDAHAVFTSQLRRLAIGRRSTELVVDILKVPHHGSRHNLESAALDVIKSFRRDDWNVFQLPYHRPSLQAELRRRRRQPGKGLNFVRALR